MVFSKIAKSSQEDGLEAISFQRQSKFAKELVDIFQEPYDYMKTVDDPKIDKLTKRRQLKIKKTTEFLKKTTMPAIVKCVKKHTGVEIKKAVVTDSEPTKLNYLPGLFAISLEFKSWDDFFDFNSAEAKYSGFGNGVDDHLGFVQSNLEAYKNFDKKTGRIPEKTSYNLQTTLYFDPVFSYFAEDILVDGENMSAEQIAGVIMHEVGHIMCWVEHIGDMYFMCSKPVDHLQQSLKKKDWASAIKETKEFAAGTKKLLENDPDKKDNYVVLDRIENAMGHLENLEKGANDPWYTVVGTPILAVMSGVLLLLFSIVHAILTSIMVFDIVDCCMVTLSKQSTDSGTKTSDRKVTKHNLQYDERMADDFTTKHGLGPALAKALIIVGKNQRHAMTGLNSTSETKNGMFAKSITKMSAFMMESAGVFEHPGTTYEKDIDRYNRILQTLTSIFKDPSLPKDIRDSSIKDVLELDKLIQEETSRKSRKIGAFLYDNLSAGRLLGALTGMILNGRIENDFYNLQNDIDRLTNNKLYYVSARFSQLLDR